MDLTYGRSPVSTGNKSSSISRYNYTTTTTKDSKAQHILGLSRAELRTARSQSLNPKFKFSSIRKSIRGKADIRSPQVYIQEKSSDSLTSSNLDLHTDPIVLHEESIKSPETISLSDSTSSERPPSSPSQSEWDIIQTSPKIAQRITNPSSRPNPLPRTGSSTSQPKSQAIEHARQLKFFKPSQAPSKLEQTTDRPVQPVLDDLRSPIEKAPIVTQITTPLTSPPPPSPMPHATVGTSTKVLRKRAPNHRHNKNVKLMAIDITAYSPYAKINVRRPKAGAEHWFDSLDIETSDEEDNEEPELQQHFVADVEHAFQSGRIGNASPFFNDSRTDTVAGQPVANQYKHHMSSLADFSRTLPKPNRTSDVPVQSIKRYVAQQHVVVHPFAAADLTQESVLYLSSSDDDNKSHSTEQNLSPERATSVANGDTVGGSQNANSRINYQLPQIPTIKPLNLNSVPATPVSVSSMAVLTGAHDAPTTIRNCAKEVKVDVEERAMLNSFPTTPLDGHASRKSSFRSSYCLSDDASVVSTRLMKVTRQEEALLAAMRLKKVTMKRAAKERNRKAALEVLETTQQLPSIDGPLDTNGRPDVRDEHEGKYRHQSPIVVPPLRSGRNCESITTFQTESCENRNSQFTFLSDESEENQLSSLSAASERPVVPKQLLESPFPPTIRDNQRPDTFHSFTTDDSERRENPIVVLDNLHSALRRRDIPSQLFIVSPFVGWDRAELATAR